ncbi:trypsin-like serine protease [Intrasporangium calvum]|uniref:Trypsin-like serine protease n=1 Tax=Intrasporangium calvum TaxID=53358 RepID=A0ABT5GIC0_9MICO|nr:trypsin-like serine protease [Intrasporangium calvum]MDC5698000.1 trypsin-like serine protease [Intrasporangium calvum]
MRRLITALVASIALIAGVSLPATAVTDGTLDGDGHPYVGLMVAQKADGTPLWRCSGTLISPTVYLTAGHCTEAPAEHVEIWFDADVQSGIPENGYPNTGDASGTPYTHPDYDPNAFYVRDVGVVVLDEPVEMAQYGVLPTQDQLDALKVRRSTTFTSVGYGLQQSFPSAAGWKTQAERIRMVANPHLLQINTGFTGDQSLLLSNNTNTGGTCFGDSGGPNFLGTSNVIAGVTSFGLNSTCGGTGGVMRVDRDYVLDWVNSFLD